MNYVSDKMHMAIGLQPDALTAVVPDIFVPLMDEDMKVDPKNERVKQIVGIDWASNKMLQGEREAGGSITIQADPDNLGHFLNMTIKKGTSSGSAGAGYTHPFTVDDANYYTIEIVKGNAVQRFIGCQIGKLEFSFDGGYLVLKAEVIARGAFSTGTLKTALTGAGMVAVVFDELYDPEPCNGLVTGDIIQVQKADGTFVDVTVATVAANKKSITCAATDATASIGALISLKQQTPSYETLQRPFKFGQCLVGFGANQTAADANVASYALATPVDEFSVVIDRNMNRRRASGKNDALTLVGPSDGEFTVKKLFETAAQQQQWMNISKKACSILFTGDNIATSYYSSLAIKLHNIKPNKHDNKLKKGEFIYDETSFNVEYDDTDGKAIEVTLINKTIGTDMEPSDS